MAEQVPSKERVGQLIAYWEAKAKSHERFPEGSGGYIDALARIYTDTIAALKAQVDATEGARIFAPKRYFLDAPKEEPGTCFVKNDDYVDVVKEVERLQQLLRHAAQDCHCADVCVDLRAGVDGEWLYQQLPGWDANKPLQRPSNEPSADTSVCYCPCDDGDPRACHGWHGQQDEPPCLCICHQPAPPPSESPVGWQYEINGAYVAFSETEPPSDAYDHGTLRPLYARPTQPAAVTQSHGLARAQLDNMRTLQPNWDSYGAVVIDQRCIEKAHELLNSLQPGWCAVPCSDGNVQLEWHRDGFDIEILIDVASQTACEGTKP